VAVVEATVLPPPLGEETVIEEAGVCVGVIEEMGVAAGVGVAADADVVVDTDVVVVADVVTGTDVVGVDVVITLQP
jgi:hypothetical protein